jgi:hypothetical protein
MYAKYYLVIPCRTLGTSVLPMRSSNASRFCRFYVDVVEVLRTSVLPLSSDVCWFSRVRIEQRLLLYIVVMPWEGEPSTLLYWKIPCIGAHILRRSCSSTTLVLPPSAPLTLLGEHLLGWTYLMSTIRISYVVDVTCVMPYTYLVLCICISGSAFSSPPGTPCWEANVYT